MRYMGDATPAPAFPAGLPAAVPTNLDPIARAQLVAGARNATDDQAQLLLDMADASALGHRTEVQRYGLGAIVGGVVVGLLVYAVTR